LSMAFPGAFGSEGINRKVEPVESTVACDR
jgi:hypothetical protein